MVEKGDGKTNQPICWWTEVAANTGLALGQASQWRGWPRVCRVKRLAGRTWRNPRLTVSYSCFCASSPTFTPSLPPICESLTNLWIPHPLKPMEDSCWAHHLIVQHQLKNFSYIFYLLIMWDCTFVITFDSFPSWAPLSWLASSASSIKRISNMLLTASEQLFSKSSL